MQPASPHIVLVGAAHIDRVARAAAPYRARTSNPGATAERVGGACFNAASALARFGAAPLLVSVRGGDTAASRVEDAVSDLGITDCSMTWLDRTTPTYTAILDDRGELVAGVADMGLYDLMQPRILARRHICTILDEADAIVVDANLPAGTLEHLARTSSKPVAAIAVSPGKVARLAGCLESLSVLFLSCAEAASLTDARPASPVGDLATRLAAAGVRRAVVTDGPRPATILDGGRIVSQSPPPVERVRDVTGAGDTLAAVTLAEWLSGRPFVEAARTGMAAASLHIAFGLTSGCAPLCRDLGAALPLPQPIAFQEISS